MTASAETIHEYFRRFGWQCEFDDETRTWVTGFRGKNTNFNVLVHLTDNWVYLIVSPFVNAPTTVDCEHRLCEYLLRVNHTINMAKFSIDSDGDIVLTVELPTEDMSYSQFRDGLNAVSYYADNHYLDVLNLAQNPGYEPQQSCSAEDAWWAAAGLEQDLEKPN